MEADIEKLYIDKANLVTLRDNKKYEQVDIQILINTAKHFLEHLDELILAGTNKIQNAAMFGLLFDELPTYDELVFGTPKLAPVVKLNEEYKKTKELSVSYQRHFSNE